MTDAGLIYVVQNNLTGTLDVYTEPGLYRRVPFFSQVTTYKQIQTMDFEEDGQNMFQMVPVRFADTYAGKIPVSFRFRMSQDPELVRKMHKEFRSSSNLRDALLARNARNVTVITATQYTGEEFFQGGLNTFKTQLADQLNNGIYETERKQVEIDEVDYAPVGYAQADSRKLQKSRQLVWKTVPTLDSHGLAKRAENPLRQYGKGSWSLPPATHYKRSSPASASHSLLLLAWCTRTRLYHPLLIGIEVTQVLLSDPKPEPALDKLLLDKKMLVADRIKAVQEQETAKAQAKTEQSKKEIQRTREVQDAQRERELAVIGQQRQVDVARQVAEREVVEQEKLLKLAKIDKEKELAIATANLAIQKANSDSSIYEAKAIAAKGKAEAEVLAAMYRAKAQNKEVYLAEVQRDIASTIYSNLRDFKIEMPHNYIGGGSGSGSLTSNLDVITGLSALGLMEKATGPSPKGVFSK
jgi:hypothetical protein